METNQMNRKLENVFQSEIKNQDKKHVFNFSLNSFSIESSSHFNKAHKRRFHSFGCIHQQGKLPGAMF